MRFFTNFLRAGGHWLLGAAIFFGHVNALAQTSNGGMSCGFDQLQEAAFARQPGSKAAYERFLAEAARLATQPAARGTLGAAPDITIPVVVHIVLGLNANGGFNPTISDAQVNDALRIANLDYSKSNADTLAVIPAFQGRIANVGFRFRLAKIDPNGNCTTGIIRTFSRYVSNFLGQGGTNGVVAEGGLKRDRWDPARYLNIWVVDGMIAEGYAYLPCTGGSFDGIVIQKRSFGSIGTSTGTNAAARVLTHELGHYFGLLHTFGPSNSAGLASNCGLSDGVADTPPTTGTYGCNLALAACPDPQTNQPVLANVQNYMDYGSCSNMFTVGQRAVMRAALTLGCRDRLVSAANLVATGTNDGYQPPAGGCPTLAAAGINVSPSVGCYSRYLGNNVRSFIGYGTTDALNAAGASYQWSFPGGVPATATGQGVRVNYPTPGSYPVTLTITPAGGGAPVSHTEPKLVLAGGPGTGLVGGVEESFENPAFPYNFGPADLRNWGPDTLVDNFQWRRTSGGGLVAADGAACLVVPNSPNTNYVGSAIIKSPAIDLSGFASNPAAQLRLSFRTARADNPTTVGGSNGDQLVVSYGNDCEGSNNTDTKIFTSLELQVAGQAAQNGFVPASNQQWTTLTVPIQRPYRNTWFKFTFITFGGNPFYLDQVRVYDAAAPLGTQAAAVALGLEVYPSPATGELRLHYPAPGPAPTGLRLYDALGRQVRAFAAPARPDEALSLRGLAAGVYVLRAELAGQPVSRRVVVAE